MTLGSGSVTLHIACQVGLVFVLGMMAGVWLSEVMRKQTT